MIDKTTILHIAKLARLHVTEEEAQAYSTQLASALSHFQQISKVDTTGVEPLVTPTDIETYWREDVVQKDFSAEDMTANAPSKVGNLFKVPPVV